MSFKMLQAHYLKNYILSKQKKGQIAIAAT